MRYFVAAGHIAGAGARGQGLEEGRVAIQVAHALQIRLSKLGHETILVPDSMDLKGEIAYVNKHAHPGDRALELHLNAAGSANAHGCCVAVTSTSRPWAAPIIGRFTHELGIVPWGKGVYAETEIAHMRGWHHLGWCADIHVSSALLEMGFITNRYDATHFKSASGLLKVAMAIVGAVNGPTT